ncbi:MAG TPA: DUF3053 family protein [Stellaceae bacterium]|nr:DUF3053 family protein [Stellaceae bacterium]
MRWAALAAAAFALVLAGAGCNDEPGQRQAFIAFLKSRIIDKPGVHVPHPTADEAKSFGRYAADYAIITDFNDGLDRSIAEPMQQAMARGAVHSIEEVVARHADFVATRDGINELRAALDKQLAAADARHAALKQPDDLKPVFDRAYERDVTVPAKAFSEIFPDLSQALTAIADLGDFLEQHKDAVTIDGATLRTSDPQLQSELTALVNALSAKNAAIAAAQQHLRELLNGS